MTRTTLTPDRVRWICARIADSLGFVRRIVDQIRAAARIALRAINELVEAWRRSPAAALAAAPSRPAWMSPYGPPARRHR